MSIISEKEILNQAAMDIAHLMIAAAKTAPKAKGIENMEYLILYGAEKEILSEKMKEISARDSIPFFTRDAENIMQSELVVFIGSNNNPKNIPSCSICGYSCKDKPDNIPCAVGATDLGIAIGSAVSTAMLHKADSRIMYSAGIAILELGWFSENIKQAYGIPISLKAKNPFFDRK